MGVSKEENTRVQLTLFELGEFENGIMLLLCFSSLCPNATQPPPECWDWRWMRVTLPAFLASVHIQRDVRETSSVLTLEVILIICRSQDYWFWFFVLSITTFFLPVAFSSLDQSRVHHPVPMTFRLDHMTCCCVHRCTTNRGFREWVQRGLASCTPSLLRECSAPEELLLSFWKRRDELQQCRSAPFTFISEETRYLLREYTVLIAKKQEKHAEKQLLLQGYMEGSTKVG